MIPSLSIETKVNDLVAFSVFLKLGEISISQKHLFLKCIKHFLASISVYSANITIQMVHGNWMLGNGLLKKISLPFQLQFQVSITNSPIFFYNSKLQVVFDAILARTSHAIDQNYKSYLP